MTDPTASTEVAKAISEAAKAVAVVVEKVPVYQDLIQPAARATGDALGTIVAGVLSPVALPFWMAHEACDWAKERVAEKLRRRGVPPEQVQRPSLLVAGPALEAMRFVGPDGDDVLQDMYASLLAAAMDKETARAAHPAYVEILKQLSPDEARMVGALAAQAQWPTLTIQAIHANPLDVDALAGANLPFDVPLRHFTRFGEVANCEHQEMLDFYLTNLERLGLIEVNDDNELVGADYGSLRTHRTVLATIDELTARGDRVIDMLPRYLQVTSFGTGFIAACTSDADSR
jgi:hypothetical protein